MAMSTVLAGHSEKHVVGLEHLFVEIVGFPSNLLLDKIMKHVSVFMSEQSYLFIVKYLVAAALELLKLEVAPATFTLALLLIFFSPEKIRVNEKHPWDRDHRNDYIKQVEHD